MQPTVSRLEERYAGRIVFTSLDIDDARNADFKAALGFRVQPTFVLLDGGGSELMRWFGSVPEADFVQAFDAALR
jgi:hypothetical protein